MKLDDFAKYKYVIAYFHVRSLCILYLPLLACCDILP